MTRRVPGRYTRNEIIMADTTRLNRINTTRILQDVWKKKGISRIEIAENLGLDRSTITKIVKTLTEKNLVRIRGKEASRENLGRKPIGLEINTDIGLVLGLEIQTQFCRAMVIDLDGTVRHTLTRRFDPGSQDIPGILVETINEIRITINNEGYKLLGIGIGLSGLVDPYNGIVLRSNPLGITEPFSLKAILEKAVPEPVLVENDANCCCWGDLAFRKGARDRNFMVVLGEFRSTDIIRHREPGIAVGLGLVVRERVLHGDDFTAGIPEFSLQISQCNAVLHFRRGSLPAPRRQNRFDVRSGGTGPQYGIACELS